MEFFKTRTRPLAVCFFSLLSFILFTLSADVSSGIFAKWYGILVGIALMLLAIPCHLLGRKTFLGYVLSVALNSIGMGCSASAYYITSGICSDFKVLIVSTILPMALMLVITVIITVFPQAKEPVIAIAVILEIALIIASIVFWILRGGEFYAFSLFSHIIATFYTGALVITANEEERKLLRDISFGSFGAFVIVAVIVILVVSQGEACDCSGCDCDCCDCSPSGKRKGSK